MPVAGFVVVTPHTLLAAELLLTCISSATAISFTLCLFKVGGCEAVHSDGCRAHCCQEARGCRQPLRIDGRSHIFKLIGNGPGSPAGRFCLQNAVLDCQSSGQPNLQTESDHATPAAVQCPVMLLHWVRSLGCALCLAAQLQDKLHINP